MGIIPELSVEVTETEVLVSSVRHAISNGSTKKHFKYLVKRNLKKALKSCTLQYKTLMIKETMKVVDKIWLDITHEETT